MFPVKNLLTTLEALPALPGDTLDPPELRLKAVSLRAGAELLPGLMDAIDRASGWVLHRQMTSALALELHVETQGRALLDLYSSLLEEGLELSRESHRILSERCLCAHLHTGSRSSIISLHLDISLPVEPPSLQLWGNSQPA